MWIEEFDTVLLGKKATPDTAPFYVSKIGVPVEWGSEQVRRQYESASKEGRESIDRAAFILAFDAIFGEATSKIEKSESMTGRELTLRDEKDIPDFRFWIQLKDAATSDPKAVLFALDWNEKTIKRRLPDGSELEAVYLWHLQKSPSDKQFRQLSMFRAEYGYYLDFRYYVLRRPGQRILPCRRPDGSLDLEALMLEEPGTWVHWKIKEPRAAELQKLLRQKYFDKS
jgi:hypothetical protein